MNIQEWIGIIIIMDGPVMAILYYIWKGFYNDRKIK
jgi:hypothetical protein